LGVKLSLTPYLLALGLALTAAGCARPEEVKPPAKLLSKEEVTSLLVQFHLLEARVESSRLAPDSARALFQSQERDILWHHNLQEDDSVFQHSYRYYAAHNKDLDEIYTAVIDSLTLQEQRLKGGPEVKVW